MGTSHLIEVFTDHKGLCLAQAGLLHDLCSSCPCSSTGAKLLRLRGALLGRRGDSQVEREATITSGKVKIIQTKCFTFTEEKQSGLEVRPLQATLVNQGVEYDLIAQEVESAVQGRISSSTYTTEAGIRGVVVHM